MGYGKKIYREAYAQLEQRRTAAEQAARDRLNDFLSRCPQAAEVRQEMASNAARAAKDLLAGGDVRGRLKKRQEQGMQLRETYEHLLRENGLSREDLEPKYVCPKCKDTGFVNGEMCDCFRKLQRDLAYRRLNLQVPLEKCTFATFSLEPYRGDDRAYQQMSSIFAACQDYAQRFRTQSPSLLFMGGTGLGKTHLSLAIAGAALEKGFGVIYSSVQSLAVALERERFQHPEDSEMEDTATQVAHCDLLILDDLGAEFQSAYVSACLYDILNLRLLANRPTVISTNLSITELEARYGQRLSSRIAGAYGMMVFLGADQRLAQRKQAHKRTDPGTKRP